MSQGDRVPDTFESGANIEMVVNPFEGQAPVAGRFQIYTEVGAGPFGRVYVAKDQQRSGRRVAVKVLTPRMSTDFEDPTGRQRFIRAARDAARLDHPDIVPVLAIDTVKGESADQVAVVYEYESWPVLSAVMAERGSLALDEAVRIVDRVAVAVDHAHEHDVLHLGLHPANIFIGPDGDVRVGDFGLRGAVQADVTPETPQKGAFLAPEQKTGGPVDRSTDVYALGLLLQHLLTGDPPDAKSTAPLPGAMDLVVERATREEMASRLPGMEAFRHALAAPAAYRTPVPSGVFVKPEVGQPRPLELASTAGVPIALWLVLGVGVMLLCTLCVGVIGLMGVYQ